MQTYSFHTPAIEEMLEHELSSLCNTCDHFTSCSFPDARKNVLHCEIFENEPGIAEEVSLYIQPKEQLFFPEVKGICSNCSMLKVCRLPKDQAGVWHCEEYV